MNFHDLTEQQILALAISAEEEDSRIYADFAEGLRSGYPATAELFQAMAGEESGHRHRLIDLYRTRFGEHIPLIRREDVQGFYTRKSRLFGLNIRPERARAEAAHAAGKLYFHHSWDGYLERSTSPFPRIKDHVLLPAAELLPVVDAPLESKLEAPILRRIVDAVPAEWLSDEPAFATPREHRDAYMAFLTTRLRSPRAFVEEAISARRALL